MNTDEQIEKANEIIAEMEAVQERVNKRFPVGQSDGDDVNNFLATTIITNAIVMLEAMKYSLEPRFIGNGDELIVRAFGQATLSSVKLAAILDMAE